jgi:hypothetical protein
MKDSIKQAAQRVIDNQEVLSIDELSRLVTSLEVIIVHRQDIRAADAKIKKSKEAIVTQQLNSFYKQDRVHEP